jgi:hypothetical protein
MSDDPDLPKANHALLVIRQARLSRNEAAAMMIADLIYETPTPHSAAPKLKKLIKPRGWPFPSWRDPSVKKSSRLPRFGTLHSERQRAGENCWFRITVLMVIYCSPCTAGRLERNTRPPSKSRAMLPHRWTFAPFSDTFAPSRLRARFFASRLLYQNSNPVN